MAEYIEREAAIAETRKPRLTDAELRRRIANIPAADVVARDCYDKILAENDDMRAIIDTYGGLENIQSAFEKLHEIETADVVTVVRCGECKLYGGRPWENGKTGICARTDIGVVHDDFCSYGLRMDGDA